MYCFFTTSIFYSEITLLPLGCHRFFPAPTSWQLRSVKTAVSICLCKYVMMGICGNAEEVITYHDVQEPDELRFWAICHIKP
jgi:hypothetical protein